MKILADENIVGVQHAFAEFGDLRLCVGRNVDAKEVGDADVLLVRSVTPVDANLLEGSNVKFVGSATSGTDHVDTDFLASQGIAFADAKGSNAISVAEYVVSAVLTLMGRKHSPIEGLRVGIIGYGEVGRRVHARLVALGCRCLVNDPLVAAQGSESELSFVSLTEVVDADVVSLHVPLTYAGSHPQPTAGLFDASIISRMNDGAVLINAARGGLVDETALLARLREGSLAAVIDCWAGEPQVSVELLNEVALATPHIAGYSLDGKYRGTEMIYQAACAHFGRTPQWRPELQDQNLPTRRVVGDLDDESLLRDAIAGCYDIERDDLAFKQTQIGTPEFRAKCFDQLRKHYFPRREFSAGRIAVEAGRDHLGARLQSLGFKVEFE